ncbi:hypothetical protein DLAC_03417 [Tieghemostelium lacteum]|uniref:Uncharacterized protein n=1 Tax=Tieghemostelium lacteum TaxID=361077 RepID=A0A152A224_TIELA|nr:hypothetical protein DLAC_03417 [Tieghemostelium lacteum]|eukprot:KYR00254.1 hypothetical protein DLAC_03417 [Tieghemostelium lacteum]
MKWTLIVVLVLIAFICFTKADNCDDQYQSKIDEANYVFSQDQDSQKLSQTLNIASSELDACNFKNIQEKQE